MKSLLGASFNKSHGASCNTIKLILQNQSDIKWHFAFLYSFKFCQTFLLNTIFYSPSKGCQLRMTFSIFTKYYVFEWNQFVR